MSNLSHALCVCLPGTTIGETPVNSLSPPERAGQTPKVSS